MVPRRDGLVLLERVPHLLRQFVSAVIAFRGVVRPDGGVGIYLEDNLPGKHEMQHDLVGRWLVSFAQAIVERLRAGDGGFPLGVIPFCLIVVDGAEAKGCDTQVLTGPRTCGAGRASRTQT